MANKLKFKDHPRAWCRIPMLEQPDSRPMFCKIDPWTRLMDLPRAIRIRIARANG